MFLYHFHIVIISELDSFSMGLQSERAQKSNKENAVALRAKSIQGSASPALDPMIKFIKMINVYT